LEHHHLSSSEYKEHDQGNSELDDIKNINQSILLTEGWHSEIIITTFNQLLNSVVTNQNKLARKFHNIANSVIILDEIQALPVKYYSLIRETLNYLAKNFNCWIIAMSATQPIIFGSGAKELTGEPKKFFDNFDRFDFRFDMSEKKYDYLFEKIFNDIIYGDFYKKDIIIILNTVSICKKFYNDLKEKISQTLNKKGIIDFEGIYNIGDLEIINLSTSILPIYRLAKIKRIREDKKRKIIVTTQLVEAGVDISADVIYRDLAPLDCLIQSAGRCNRNNKQKKGVVNVFVMANDNDKNYYSFIYDPVLIGITKEIIGDKKEVSEKDFSLKIINNYYDKVIQRMDTETDGKKIFDDMKNLKFQKTRDFELIKNQKTMSIFVEIDQKAKKVRENLEKILNLENGIDKKNELLKIKQAINQYTLSVNFTYNLRSLQCLPSIGNLEKEDFKYIPLENLDDWYMKDSGLDLKLENKIDNVIF
jgi:CRISPR-associated endonuclease/helicase Cas3